MLLAPSNRSGGANDTNTATFIRSFRLNEEGVCYGELSKLGIRPDPWRYLWRQDHRRSQRADLSDLYLSAFVGALENGFGAYEAAVLAADYTVRCIELTQDDPDHWYGVKFEKALPYLINRLS